MYLSIRFCDYLRTFERLGTTRGENLRCLTRFISNSLIISQIIT